MPTPQRSSRRSDALSRERIVGAAIEILDREGEGGLTFRALATRLSTGPGAIYHHIDGKERLLAAASDRIVAGALATGQEGADPERAIRSLALGIFDAIDAHPWIGAQLSDEPSQRAVLRIWKAIGLQLLSLGVTGAALADAGSALVNYVLGSAAQYAVGPRTLPDPADRQRYLESFAARWEELDPAPVVRELASQLRDHDDRRQFLAGVDFFLAGIAAKS